MMKRRQFVAAFGSVAVWPALARAEQPSLPVVIYLQFGQVRGSLTEIRDQAFLTGLHEAGFDNGRNVIVEPVPVPDQESLVAIVSAQAKRKVAVIHGNLMVAAAARAATNAIPIVFGTVDDPLGAGLISGYNRPGGNVTGVRMRAGDEPAKLIELLCELLPAAKTIGVLVHPGALSSASIERRLKRRLSQKEFVPLLHRRQTKTNLKVHLLASRAQT
jgi:putative ABC transport system substrate-binding protein